MQFKTGDYIKCISSGKIGQIKHVFTSEYQVIVEVYSINWIGKNDCTEASKEAYDEQTETARALQKKLTQYQESQKYTAFPSTLYVCLSCGTNHTGKYCETCGADEQDQLIATTQQQTPADQPAAAKPYRPEDDF